VDTGFPDADSSDDFMRARRQQVLSRLSSRLRLHRQSGDLDLLLPFDEVVAALGNRGEQRRGLQEVPLDSIVGSVDRPHGFDRKFRPTSSQSRRRFERLAAAYRRGEEVPPVWLYKVGEAHFVRDGHHRIAVARALRRPTVWAHVTEILTAVGTGADLRLSDLPLKGHQRLFAERVPLPPAGRSVVVLSDADDYALLAEGIEAWGFRVMQDEQRLLSRKQVAERWFHDEFQPVVALLQEARLIEPSEAAPTTLTAAYLRLADERYRLLRTHAWDERVIERLREERNVEKRRRR
jgi:hypothetical protein